MEQNQPSLRLRSSPAVPSAAQGSLIDCLFDMPERFFVKRASAAEKAEHVRLEARLAAQMRALIAARLKNETA